MRLLIAVGLTLLVGETWAQHSSFFTINSATDLLALPSDQLIPSDIDHEAVESIIHTAPRNSGDEKDPFAATFNLPFGARLPGYDRVQYAYGYQIPGKSETHSTQSVSFPADIFSSQVKSDTEVTSSPLPLPVIATTTESITPTTEITTTIQEADNSTTKLTSSPSKHQTKLWFNSTYFPQFPNLNLSPPEVEHTFPEKIMKAQTDAETALPSLELSYLPPVLDLIKEPSPSLPVATPTSFVVPNLDEPETEVEIVTPDSDEDLPETSYLPPNLDPILEVKDIPEPPLPETSYLPPNPDPILEVKDIPEPPLLETSYLPPNPDPILEVKDIPDPPLLETSYLPPNPDPKLEIGQETNPIILIPISSTLIDSPEHPAIPLGVIENPDDPIHFLYEEKPIKPLGVIGEDEADPLEFVGERQNPPPTGVIGEREDHPVKFIGDRRNPPPSGVIGEHKFQPVRFVGEKINPVPTGVIGEHEDQPIKFSGDRKILPPAGVVGVHEERPLKFSAERKNVPAIGVIGEQEDSHLKFSGQRTHPIPFGLISELKTEKLKPIREHSDISPYAVVPEIRDTVISAHAEQSALHPIGVISEITENTLEANAYPQPIVIAATPKDNSACTQNYECSEEEICMDGMCINACVIAIGLCVGNAVCHARRHIPGCVCPDMFTAVTLRGSEQDRYDCMPMMMMAMPDNRRLTITQGRSNSAQGFIRPIANHRQNFNSIFLPPIGVLTERGVSQGRITTNVRQTSFNRAGACSPSPCGPNTRCEVSPRGIALCRCLADFVPDGNTINGCKPQCTVDDDCPDDYRCRATKCVRVCVQGACGTNAECDARNHRPVCSCPNNYRGDPHISCSRERPQVKVAPPAPPLDPCQPNPCGLNADCRTRGDRPVCTCPLGYEGDPLTNCRRGECIENNDCPGHRVCQRLRCIDPCQEGVCGSGSECTVRNHQPICSCPRGFTGDPFVNCRRFDPQELCSPSPCGRNTNCKVRNDRAVCSCIDNYIGNPLTECRPECVTDSECPHNLACRNNICVNPCRDACGEGAYCDVRNNRAVCSCPEFYQGDPYSRCYAECTAHDDCPSYQACFQLRCVDPCEGACGTGANCKVENHKPICSCPKGYTGHPFESCRPFTRDDLCNPNPCGTQADCTPGFDSSGNDRPVCTCPVGFVGNPLIGCERGECQDHNQCRDHEACYAYTCQNPCYTDVGSVCGENANCNVKNHQPVCSCPPGYDGNPLTECRVGRGGGFVAGRIRK